MTEAPVVPDGSCTVVVAMLTFRRPAALARILPALVSQIDNLSEAETNLVVIDNDPDASAETAVSALAERSVRYVHEPRPGIAAARNRALDEAAGADALVFIDDDEMPSERWLALLVGRWREWGCAAVTGPVVARFEVVTEPWIVESRVFARHSQPTGSSRRGAATNNLLLDLAAVRSLHLRFDETFGLTGGEDTMFTHALVQGGGRILWCDEAEVFDPIPPDRTNRRWVLRRTYRAGTSWSRVELKLAGSRSTRMRTRLSLFARAGTQITAGIARLIVGLLTRNIGRRARATVIIVSYAGLLSGAFGFSYREYGRPTRALT